MNRWTRRQGNRRRLLTWLVLALPLGGCASELDGDEEEEVESTARVELSVEGPAAGGEEEFEMENNFCPGPPPPPIPCATVVCVVGDGAWAYSALPAGTPCEDGGTCDGQMNCIIPQPTQRRLAIPQDHLNQLLGPILLGSEFWVDATGNSPGLTTDVHWECVDPPGPLPSHCWLEGVTHDSYIAFSAGLKSLYNATTGQTLADYPLPAIGFFCVLGITCATVNQINGDLGDTRVSFHQDASGPNARLTVPMQSPSPTVIVDSGVPDLEVTAMELVVDITLLPAYDGVGLGGLAASNVRGDFNFDANWNNFPDWLVDFFWDVGDFIRGKVTNGVHDAFLNPGRRKALSVAITKAVKAYAQILDSQFTGFASVNFISASGGTLFIDYVPN